MKKMMTIICVVVALSIVSGVYHQYKINSMVENLKNELESKGLELVEYDIETGDLVCVNGEITYVYDGETRETKVYHFGTEIKPNEETGVRLVFTGIGE